MILIGEKLNSSIPKTFEAFSQGDDNAIISLIKAQSSADYIDINTARCSDELGMMEHVVSLVKEHTDCGIVLDSPDVSVLCKASEFIGDRKLIFNSVTADTDVSELLPIAKSLNAGIVVMPMRKIVPQTSEERTEIALEIISRLDGISMENIYIDAIAEAVSTADNGASVTLDTIRSLRSKLPKAHVICGLSNISFGLPGRQAINSAFAAIAMSNGLDGAILDVSSKQVMSSVYATQALLGLDEYCMDYITYYRENE